MNELASTEFRKTFARLSEQTAVTVNGHYIGVWVPAFEVGVTETHMGPSGTPVTDRMIKMSVSPQQARDELLNKINRSK